MIITTIISIISFSGIVLQDFKQFAIHWIWLILLLSAFVMDGLIGLPLIVYIKNSLFNLCFLLILFGLLTLFFSILKKKLIFITKEMIGWGDILFFVVLAFGFSPVNFIIAFNILMISVLLFVIIYKLLRTEIKQIPLAGAMSLVLMLFMIISKIFVKSFNPFDDNELFIIINNMYV